MQAVALSSTSILLHWKTPAQTYGPITTYKVSIIEILLKPKMVMMMMTTLMIIIMIITVMILKATHNPVLGY